MIKAFSGTVLCAALTALPALAQNAQTAAPPVPTGSVRLETCLDVALRALGGSATHVEFESRDGVPTYEFVIRSGPTEFYVGCNGQTGLLGRIDVIVGQNDPRWSAVARIDEAAARRAATDRFPDGEIEEVKRLLMGDGRAAYEVDVEFDDRRELNVYVDAGSGAVILVNAEYWEIGARESPTGAGANETASCSEGIERIKAALAANPAPETRTRLERARTIAEREQRENELDECLDAVDEVRALLTR